MKKPKAWENLKEGRENEAKVGKIEIVEDTGDIVKKNIVREKDDEFLRQRRLYLDGEIPWKKDSHKWWSENRENLHELFDNIEKDHRLGKDKLMQANNKELTT